MAVVVVVRESSPIEAATPLELRRTRGEHRGRGPGLDGLELHPAGASLEEPPVISATLPLKSIPSATPLAVVSAPNFAGSRTRDPAVTMVVPPRRRQEARVRPSRRPDRPIP